MSTFLKEAVPSIPLEVIAGFNKGDEKAFYQIYNHYYSTMQVFAFRLVDDIEDAKDITISSFTKLFEKHGDFVELSHIRAFLYTITRNACLDFIKLQKKTRSRKQELFYLQMQDEGALEPEMISGEALRLLYNAIEELPAERKKVIKLLYMDGLKLAEVADQLGLSVQTVKNYRTKAIESLKINISAKHLALLLTCHTLLFQ